MQLKSHAMHKAQAVLDIGKRIIDDKRTITNILTLALRS